jgi:two-component system, LytTR family, response regulator
MYRINVVIIDKKFDNEIDLKCLIKINKFNVCGVTGFVRNGIDMIRQLKPEIIFIGIDLIDGCAFDLLNEFYGYKFHVIFLINKNDILEKLFYYSGINYLVKPIEAKQLKTLIQRLFITSSNPENNNQNYEDIWKKIHSNKLVFPIMGGYLLVDISKIVSCEIINNCVILYLNDDSHFVVTVPLCSIEVLLHHANMLSENKYAVFYRIHNKYIINLQYLSKFITNKGSYVQLTNGKKLHVSLRKAKGLKDLLKSEVIH